MAGQVTEDVAAQVAGHADKCEARGPAGDPPQEIIGGDQCYQEAECQPYAITMRRSRREAINQIFDTILRAYRTGDGRCDCDQDDDMRCKTLAQIAQHECEGTMRIAG